MVQTIKTMSTATTHIETEKQLLPELRFGEFENNWSKKKIQTLIDQEFIVGHLDGNHGELYPKSEEFVESGIPYVSANDFIDGITTLDHCKFLTEERAATFKKGIAKDGDVLFAHNATVGPTAVLTTRFSFVILSTTATYYRCNPEKLINYFLKNYFQTDSFIRQYFRVKSQSTRDQVPITQQRKFDTFLPSLPEQQKIASFLSAVDEKIQQLTKKKELLEQYKKGVMQRLFCPNHDSLDLHDEQDYKSEKNQENLINPKKSRLRPLRFKDENGNSYPDWEEKRLDKLFTYRNGGRFEDDVSDDGAINLISLNSVDIEGNLKLTQKKVNINIRETDKMLSKGELVMVLSDVAHGNFLGLSAIIPENDKYVLNYRMGALKAKEELNSFFIAQLINHNQRYFKLHGQGSSQLNLTKADVLQFAPPMPCIEEQQKIATYLSGIDTKIESVNTQITQTQSFKKGLLQQMFV
jgi:type I restriction enzyme S subunit